MLLVPCMNQPVHIVPEEGATTNIIDNRWSERTSVRWWGTPCGGRLRPLFAAAGDGLWLCVLCGDVVLVACEGVVLLGVARDAAAPPCVPSCRCGRGTQWSRRCGRRAGEEPHGPRLWSMSGRSNNRLLSLLQNRPLFQVIYPGYLWARDKRWLLSRVQRLAGPAGETGAFRPGWRYQPGQKIPFLSRLVAPPGTKGPCPPCSFGPGTKATFCPGSKGNRDKWPGTKAYSVVVKNSPLGPLLSHYLCFRILSTIYLGYFCYLYGEQCQIMNNMYNRYSIMRY